MDDFCRHFEAAIPELKKSIMSEFAKGQTQYSFRSVWEYFEAVIIRTIAEFLKQPPLYIPTKNIKEAKSKSTYPDLKVEFDQKLYAIDVKSGDDAKKDPWYDMGRLDTYAKRHLDKYAAEYYVTVRWKDKEAPKVIDVYIEPSYKSVGYVESYKGLLYRPYDGKIRPKLWSDFERGYTHWINLAQFKHGLKIAQVHRWMVLIAEWYTLMNEAQRSKVKGIMISIDTGRPVSVLEDAALLEADADSEPDLD